MKEGRQASTLHRTTADRTRYPTPREAWLHSYSYSNNWSTINNAARQSIYLGKLQTAIPRSCTCPCSHPVNSLPSAHLGATARPAAGELAVSSAHQASATLGRRLALCRDREFCEQPAAFHVWPRARDRSVAAHRRWEAFRMSAEHRCGEW